MYAIIRPSPLFTPATPDFKSEIEWGLKYGTYSAPRPAPIEFLATTPDFYRARKLAQFLANDLGEKTEVVPVMFASGLGGVIHTAEPEQQEPCEEPEKYDGVPADTGSV